MAIFHQPLAYYIYKCFWHNQLSKNGDCINYKNALVFYSSMWIHLKNFYILERNLRWPDSAPMLKKSGIWGLAHDMFSRISQIRIYESTDSTESIEYILFQGRYSWLLRPLRPGPCLNFGLQLTLSQPGGQIMPTTVLWALSDSNSPWHPWFDICFDFHKSSKLRKKMSLLTNKAFFFFNWENSWKNS